MGVVRYELPAVSSLATHERTPTHKERAQKTPMAYIANISTSFGKNNCT